MDGIQFSSYSSRGLTPFKIKLFYSGKDGLVGSETPARHCCFEAKRVKEGGRMKKELC